MGGTRDSAHAPNGMAPCNFIYRATLTASSHRWWSDAFYLPDAMYGFGLVLLTVSSMHYVVLFGGTHMVKEEESNAWTEEAMCTVYVLALDRALEALSESELAQRQKEAQSQSKTKSKKGRRWKNKNQNKNEEAEEKSRKEAMSRHGLWLELKAQLSEAGNYWAFYDSTRDVIDLLSEGGTHSSVSVQEIVSMAQITDQKHAMFPYRCNPWTEGGKTVVPTKMKLKTFGPSKRKVKNGLSAKEKAKMDKKLIKHKNGKQKKTKVEESVSEAKDIGKGFIQVGNPMDDLEAPA